MTVETTSIDTLVVGAGQAGVAMSEHLSKLGVPHLVLERAARIAERWRTWDALGFRRVANAAHAWHDRFPQSRVRRRIDPDAFAPKEQIRGLFRRLCGRNSKRSITAPAWK